MSAKSLFVAMALAGGIGCGFPEYDFRSVEALGDSSIDSASTDVSSEACTNPAAPNLCGGCAVLGGEPSKECNLGTQCPGIWKCVGTEKVSCEGGQAFNACGTCTAMTGKPNDACGACGTYACSTDNTALICNEAMPADKSPCGLGCSTSRWTCQTTTPRTTLCVRPDEAVLVDTENTTNNTDANGLCNEYRKAVSFSVQHKGQITNLAASMSRRTCSCEVCGSTRGDVVVTIYRGTPKAPGAVIGTGRLGDGAIVEGWNDFPITGSPILEVSDPIYFELRYTGNSYSFAFNSSTTWKAGQTPWFIRTTQTEFSNELNFKLSMLACTK